MPTRNACSLRVYHCEVKMTQAGTTAASAAPRRNLQTKREAYDLQAANEARTAPQMVTLTATYLASGKSWMRRMVGNSNASCLRLH